MRPVVHAQGLCRMVPEQFLERTTAIRLWVHECERVLCDRLISEKDIALFNEFRVNVTRKFFEDTPQVRLVPAIINLPLLHLACCALSM